MRAWGLTQLCRAVARRAADRATRIAGKRDGSCYNQPFSRACVIARGTQIVMECGAAGRPAEAGGIQRAARFMKMPSGTEHFGNARAMPPALGARLEQFAFCFGQTYDSYLATENDREYFWCRERRGVVAYYRWRKYLHIVGGLLAAEEDKDALLDDFQAFAAANRRHLTFYNLPREEADRLGRRGFQVTKCGEEPIIDLTTTSWSGRSYEWLRRQENYCRRQNVRWREVPHEEGDTVFRERVVPELLEISRQHIAGTVYGRELRFFEGQFSPLELRRRRLYIAETLAEAWGPEPSPGRIEAFAVCNPAAGGRLWAIETYRRRADAPRGVVPFLMLQTARQLKAEGIERLSLSLCPALRCEQPLAGDSAIFRRGMTFWWNRMNWLFDFHGIYHFKSRFRPDFSERYVAALPRLTLRSMRSFMLLWGILEPTPLRLVQQLYRKWRRRHVRASLAVPERENDEPRAGHREPTRAEV